MIAARVRHAERADLPRVAELTAQHAAYERADPPSPDLARRLAGYLFDAATPRLCCLVAELPDGEIVGYATCAPELSTWEGREYLHMDCLFLTPGHRGLGIGALLMDAVAAEARSRGLAEVQWQTPVWNEGAIRFYARRGALGADKRRFSLRVNP
ncbi:GNAT family N-acetyltransferase [Streptomyces sp. ID05-04B]|uniref:GNAT family N-acetyltransferase n=1 Tax=unclassified Streptomyces TaxID=2593676 RepID=UPI000D1BACC4|nr:MULTISPECIES: GNAT family N-acetyltransferase [unclassified Streptomyces]AVV46954.1 GNAT family N-acetyltransferase [Streptomyces sp. P3]MDX5565058.1 GNAT family N-acetyltransferase [Streptomyces sp. ID05-04B]